MQTWGQPGHQELGHPGLHRETLTQKQKTAGSLRQSQAGTGCDLLEVELLEGEVGLHNACGLHSRPKNILLSWNVVRLGYSIQII